MWKIKNHEILYNHWVINTCVIDDDELRTITTHQLAFFKIVKISKSLSSSSLRLTFSLLLILVSRVRMPRKLGYREYIWTYGLKVLLVRSY
jgi:hypothetical protein